DQLVAGRAVGQFLAEQRPHRVDDLLAPAVTDRKVDVKTTPVAVGRLDDVGDDLDERRQLAAVTLQVFGGQQVDGGHLDAGLLTPAQHLGDLAGTHPVAVADVV